MYNEINELPLGGVNIGHRRIVALVVAKNQDVASGCTVEMHCGRLVVGGAATVRGSDDRVIIPECQVTPGYCVDAGVAAAPGKPVLDAHVVDQPCGVEIVVRLAAYRQS